MTMTDAISEKSFSLSSEFVARQFRGRRERRIRHRWLSLARLKRNMLTKGVLQSFVENSSFGVLLQIVLAVVSTAICQSQGWEFNAQMSLFIGPLVFPLAFSINACYQRREKVLDDLANFKASAMELFFCHRDWWKPAGLSHSFLTDSLQNLRDLMGYVQSYLKKPKAADRVTSVGRIYHCMSEVALATEKLRSSKLAMSGPLVTRLIHYNNMMCWSFERLRVVREYRSPRTIQAFSKVLIFVIPIVLSPYYVHIGNDPDEENGPKWAPYFVAVLVSFVLGSLQAVEDALDDPFDGISEDDINLDQLQDWAHFALIVSPYRSLQCSGTSSVTGSVVSIDEGLTGTDSSVRRRIQPDSQGNDGDTSVRKETSFAGVSGSVAIEVDVQQHENAMDSRDTGLFSLMSSPVDLLSTLPVELGPLDIDVDSFAWSQKSVKSELRTSVDEMQSLGERTPTPGSAAALRKKRAAQLIGSSSTQTSDMQQEETSLSPEALEPDSLLELRKTLDKLEQKRMRRRRRSDEEESPSYSPPAEVVSPVSAGSPTFHSNVKQFRSQRQVPSGSSLVLPSTPEEPQISSIQSPHRSVGHSPASSYPPVWTRFGHSLTDLSGHQTEDSVSRSPIVPPFSWHQNPHGIYRTRSESFDQESYTADENMPGRRRPRMQPPIYAAASDIDVHPPQPHFRWDDRRAAVGQKRIEEGQVFTYVAPGEMETEV